MSISTKQKENDVRIPKRQEFNNKTDEQKYEYAYNSTCVIHRLERIILSLLMWKDSSIYYEKAVADFKDYHESIQGEYK